MTLVLDTPVTIPTDPRSAALGKPQTVQGQVVAPGLAITPSLGTAGRYVLTHIESGKMCTHFAFCADHVQQAARLAANSGIDWTTPADQFDVAAGKRLADRIADALLTCQGCPDEPAPSAVDPDQPSQDQDAPDVRIVAGASFTAAYDKAGGLTAVKWHANGVWYVTNGGGPRTFADERPATEAFLADAGAVPS